MSTRARASDAGLDITNCDREPIQIPGAIQPHGILLVLDGAALNVVQMSANAPAELELEADFVLGSNLSQLMEARELIVLRERVQHLRSNGRPYYVPQVRFGSTRNRNWSGVVHSWDHVVMLELQEHASGSVSSSSLQASVRKTITDLDTCDSLAEFCRSGAERFRELTQFDRVMIYRFLEDGTGVVVSEARHDDLDPYLGLRYPASDIPAQARRLYALNQYRLTSDVNAGPVPLVPADNPTTGAPLDMSFCALRATSPIHLEYLRNMGVRASLSFSILRDDKLWGLIACHHRSPKEVSQKVRIAGEILARFFGLQVGLKEEMEHRNYLSELGGVRSALRDSVLRSGDFVAALTESEPNLLSAMNASGAALCTGSGVYTLGKTPSSDDIKRICDWVNSKDWIPVWFTNRLSAHYPPAEELIKTASGVLVIRVAAGSPETVVWFREEVIENVNWAGNPEKAVEPSANGSSQLHPRRSFALWRQQVRGESPPWQAVEIEHASDLREGMSQALLQHHASEISRLNAELLRSNQELEHFAAVASHDLQEPLRTISSYTQLLHRRRGSLSDADTEQMSGFVMDATQRMSALVRSLLDYARIGRKQAKLTPVPAEAALNLALKNLQSRIKETSAQIRVCELPLVCVTEDQLARVFQNLIGNALKYRRPEVTLVIEIEAQPQGKNWLLSVRDNGTGFHPEETEKVFEAFRRLHERGVSGTGLGLAICRKIVESFGGRIWAETEPGLGSTFFFTLNGG